VSHIASPHARLSPSGHLSHHQWAAVAVRCLLRAHQHGLASRGFHSAQGFCSWRYLLPCTHLMIPILRTLGENSFHEVTSNDASWRTVSAAWQHELNMFYSSFPCSLWSCLMRSKYCKRRTPRTVLAERPFRATQVKFPLGDSAPPGLASSQFSFTAPARPWRTFRGCPCSLAIGRHAHGDGLSTSRPTACSSLSYLGIQHIGSS
jgi:hypothetical protein